MNNNNNNNNNNKEKQYIDYQQLINDCCENIEPKSNMRASQLLNIILNREVFTEKQIAEQYIINNGIDLNNKNNKNNKGNNLNNPKIILTSEDWSIIRLKKEVNFVSVETKFLSYQKENSEDTKNVCFWKSCPNEFKITENTKTYVSTDSNNLLFSINKCNYINLFSNITETCCFAVFPLIEETYLIKYNEKGCPTNIPFTQYLN